MTAIAAYFLVYVQFVGERNILCSTHKSFLCLFRFFLQKDNLTFTTFIGLNSMQVLFAMMEILN